MPVDMKPLVYESKLIDGVIAYQPTKFEDDRGINFTYWSQDQYLPKRKPFCLHKHITFCQSKISISYKNVLRGLHTDKYTWKYINCLYGEIQLILVDGRKKSNTYGKHTSYYLTDKNLFCILVPPKVFNAHLVLSNKAIFNYQWSEYYNGPEDQETLFWNDPELNLPWLKKEGLILSDRDKNGKNFKDINL